MRVARATAACVLLVAAACGGGTDDGRVQPDAPTTEGGAEAAPDVDWSRPRWEDDRPLGRPLMSAGRADDGGFLEPRLQFTSADTRAYAWVHVWGGAPAGAQLTVSWYRIASLDERDHLFSHEFTVDANGYAMSEGVAAAGLAPGVYEIVATLDDAQVRAPFSVVAEGASAAPNEQGGGGGGRSRSVVASRAAAEEPEPWEVPSAGDSTYWYEEPPAAGDEPGSDAGPCRRLSVHGTIDVNRDFGVAAHWWGACRVASITASMGGPEATLHVTESDTAQVATAGGNLCDIPGGTDMPGAVVRFTATTEDGNSATAEKTLQDMGAAGPVVMIESAPAAGSRVGPGDTIRLAVVAAEPTPSRGMERVELFEGERLLAEAGNGAGVDEPVPCARNREYAGLAHEYRVPDDPPPLVTLHAIGTDFDGRRASGSVSFPTVEGEVWEGDVSGEGVVDGGTYRCPALVEGTVTLLVRSDSTVAGRSDVRFRPGGECAAAGTVPYGGDSTGTVTDDAFEICLPGLPGCNPIRKTSAVTAHAEYTMGDGSNGYELAVDLRCVTCS